MLSAVMPLKGLGNLTFLLDLLVLKKSDLTANLLFHTNITNGSY
jgi:hypothetical protein